jgi:hypothetical protein
MIAVLKTKLEDLVVVEESCHGAVNIISCINQTVSAISFYDFHQGINFVFQVTQIGETKMYFNPFESIEMYMSLRYITMSLGIFNSEKCV